MDFLSFLRGGGSGTMPSYPMVPIQPPRMSPAQVPDLTNLARFIAMIRPHSPFDRARNIMGMSIGPDFVGSLYTDPYTGRTSTTRT